MNLNVKSKKDFELYCSARINNFVSFTSAQEDAFSKDEFWNSSRDVFVSASTASGKSLIAYAAMLRNNNEDRSNRCLYVVPFRSLAMQKYDEICDFFKPRNGEDNSNERRICLSTSEYFENDTIVQNGEADIAIVIYEKLFLFINRYPDFLSRYDVVVLDEFGIVSNPERGLKSDFVFLSAISAPNIRTVALSTPFYKWDAYLNCSNFIQIHNSERPHELLYHDFYEKPYRDYVPTIVDDWDTLSEEDQNYEKKLVSNPTELLAYVCAEEYSKGNSVLVFCHSRNRTRSLVNSLYKYFVRLGIFEPMARIDAEDEFEEIYGKIGISHGDLFGIFEDDEENNTDLICNLKAAFLSGITFHNASQPYNLRSEIERRLLKSDELDIVVATDTLAYGINSNVSTVIIDAKQENDVPLTQYEYLNYCGRAGRYAPGNVYTFYNNEEEYSTLQEIIKGEYRMINSSFVEDDGRNDRAFYLLTIISREAISVDDLCTHVKRLPNGSVVSEQEIRDFVEKCIGQLLDYGLVEYGDLFDFEDELLKITEIGKAITGFVVPFHDFTILYTYVKEYEESKKFYLFDFIALLSTLDSFKSNSYFDSRDDATKGHIFTSLFTLLENDEYVSKDIKEYIHEYCYCKNSGNKVMGRIRNSEEFRYTFNGLRQAMLLTQVLIGVDIETIYRSGLLTIATVQALMSKYSYYMELMACLAAFYEKTGMAVRITAIVKGLNLGGVPYEFLLLMNQDHLSKINSRDSDMLKSMARCLKLMNKQKRSRKQENQIKNTLRSIEDSSEFYRNIWEDLKRKVLHQANSEEH